MDQAHSSGMKIIWYIAQALFIGWLTYGVWQRHPEMPPGELFIQFLISVAVCAFLTACITQSWDWTVRRLRGLNRHGGETSRHGLGLTGTGRLLGKAPEDGKRIRVRD